jgi:hypothetical protein
MSVAVKTRPYSQAVLNKFRILFHREFDMRFKRVAIFVNVFAAAMIFSGCNDSGTNVNNNPVFGNIAGLDTLYAAYELSGKPDTVKLSFDYNSSRVSSVNVEATLDSGVSWITIRSFTANSSDKATVQWLLNSDTVNFNYFGIKNAYIRISNAASSGDLILSDTFRVIGLTPFILTSPKGGESYSVSDSIDVLYSTNSDLVARVVACFRPNDTAFVLVGLADDNSAALTVISTQLVIKSMSRKFCLSGFTDLTSAWLTYPLQICIRDYNSDMRITSGDIIITQ